MKVLLQPCSGKGGSEHFQDTIVNGVDPVFFKNYLSDAEFSELKTYSPDKVEVWGMVPFANTESRKEWNELEKGDWVLFYANKHFIYSAQVTMKLHNVQLAQDLWDFDEEGRTWEYIFFVNNGQQLEVPYRPEVLGYKPNHIVQGATLLSSVKAAALMSYVGQEADNLQSFEDIEPTEKEVKEIVKRAAKVKTQAEAISELAKISEEVKEQTVKVRVSTAKVLARNPKFSRLVKERAKYICEICGQKPFMQKTGLPYAEAHHKFEIAKTMIDNPEDMICVCPTCHRVVHFGSEEEIEKRRNGA